MPRKHQLLTTGYSGHDLDSFIEKLQSNKVEVVIDVRQNPVSRKKGFSRRTLSSALESHDVEYTHIRELGVPTQLRNELRDGSRDLASYLHAFAKYLDTVDEVLDNVYDLATSKRCCLICVEHLSGECHRSVVADAVVARNGRKLEIDHI